MKKKYLRKVKFSQLFFLFQDLGFSAIWISPIVKNVEWRRGYHGYWAQDLTQVEPHFGTEGDLKALIAECHR